MVIWWVTALVAWALEVEERSPALTRQLCPACSALLCTWPWRQARARYIHQPATAPRGHILRWHLQPPNTSTNLQPSPFMPGTNLEHTIEKNRMAGSARIDTLVLKCNCINHKEISRYQQHDTCLRRGRKFCKANNLFATIFIRPMSNHYSL